MLAEAGITLAEAGITLAEADIPLTEAEITLTELTEAGTTLTEAGITLTKAGITLTMCKGFWLLNSSSGLSTITVCTDHSQSANGCTSLGENICSSKSK
jgi:hypothetical protein